MLMEYKSWLNWWIDEIRCKCVKWCGLAGNMVLVRECEFVEGIYIVIVVLVCLQSRNLRENGLDQVGRRRLKEIFIR